MLRLATQEPDPTNLLQFTEGHVFVAWVFAAVLIIGMAIIMVRALITAADKPQPAILIIALSMLTLLSIAGGVITQNDEAWTIAAAGVGALAGSVTALFERYKYDKDYKSDEDDDNEPDDESDL